jgi:hypothetical protein
LHLTPTCARPQPAESVIWAGHHAIAPDGYAAKAMNGLFKPRTLFTDSTVRREAASRQKRVVAAGGHRPDWR